MGKRFHRLRHRKSAFRSRWGRLQFLFSKARSDQKEVVATLKSWNKAWMTSGSLLSFYKYSPEWMGAWDECWSQYDQCVDLQRSTAAPRLTWQDEVENNRTEEENFKERYSRPLDDNAKLVQYLPLSVYLDKHLERPSQDRRLGLSTALNNWQQFLELAENDSSFLEGLSNSQASSAQVLTQWWKTTEQSLQPLVHKTQSYLKKLRGKPYLKNPTEEENLLELSKKIGTNKSFHHAAVFKLFCFEFHPIAWEPFKSQVLRDLQDTRQRAVGHFTRYLFAHAVNGNSEVTISSYPAPIRNDEAGYENVDFKENPYYLWDTDAQATVSVEGLVRNSTERPPRCPDYVCISHTWGRWRKPTEVQVSGVKWPVPENERYDVRKLPEMLSQSGLGCRYDWFDLFCIPQSGDDKRKDIEISNQADIFRKSSRCIAWVKHWDSWDGVEIP